MADRSAQERFSAALDALVGELKLDRSILAAVLCGSLSHDVVWEKSDIDLLLVTIDDRQVQQRGLALYADGVNVHAILMSRTEFRTAVEGSAHNSFTHALLAKARLLFTHDPTIGDLCERLKDMGRRDVELQLLRAATSALPSIDKAHKWFVTRGDLDYTALWILYAATSLAKIEVIGAHQIADREVLPQAMKLNPAFFATIYTDLLNAKKTKERVQTALDAIDRYIAERSEALFALVLDYLREAGESRSCSELEAHFQRHYDVGGITIACEYLANRRIIGQSSTPVRLTKRSNHQVQELAFFYTPSR